MANTSMTIHMNEGHKAQAEALLEEADLSTTTADPSTVRLIKRICAKPLKIWKRARGSFATSLRRTMPSIG